MLPIKSLLLTGAALLAAPALAQATPATPASPATPATPSTGGTAATPAEPSTGATPADPASTTASGAVTKGATVYDVSGGVVGTVETVEGQFATVSTGKNKARLPLSSFAKGDKGPLLGMTRDQLDAAASAAASKPATKG
jgi:hypothetical protein